MNKFYRNSDQYLDLARGLHQNGHLVKALSQM